MFWVFWRGGCRSVIEVYDLHKSYGKLKVLKGITTGISRGEVVVVIGASGSGKHFALPEPPGSAAKGKIIIDGVNITDRNVNINLIRQDVGMVFQQFNLFPIKRSWIILPWRCLK